MHARRYVLKRKSREIFLVFYLIQHRLNLEVFINTELKKTVMHKYMYLDIIQFTLQLGKKTYVCWRYNVCIHINHHHFGSKVYVQ